MTSDSEYRKNGGVFVATGVVLAVWMALYARTLTAMSSTIDFLILGLCLIATAGTLWLGASLIKKHSVGGRFMGLFAECAMIGLAISCLAISVFRGWPVAIALTVISSGLAAIIAIVRWFFGQWQKEEDEGAGATGTLIGEGEENDDEEEFSEADEDLLDGNGDDGAEGPSDMQ
ncbi:MAG: hypothetical protein WCT37_02620 [Patescibacteria group bacterium]|jgi:hypothetical protein